MDILKAWFLLAGENYVIAMLMLTMFAVALIFGCLGSKLYEVCAHKNKGANQKTYAQWAVGIWSFNMVFVNAPGVRLAIVLFYVLFLGYQIVLIANQSYTLDNFFEWGIVTAGLMLSLLVATYQHRIVSQKLKPYTQ